MKNPLLFSVLLAGLALAGCSKSTKTSTSTAGTDPALAPAAPAPAPSATNDTLGAKIDRAGDRVAEAGRDAADKVREVSRDTADAVRDAGRDLKSRYTEWRLAQSDLDADLAAGRPIVRTANAAGAPTGAIDAATLAQAINGRLHSDAMFTDLKFDVHANKKGEVELEGKVRNTDQLAHAMAIALDTAGVTQVTSKIKLDSDAGPNRND